MRLIVTKTGTYDTRRLRAGDAFNVDADTGRAMVALGSARLAPRDPLAALRQEAGALGVKVDKRWGKDKLAGEIAAATKRKAAPPAPALQPVTPTPVAPTQKAQDAAPAGKPVGAMTTSTTLSKG